MATFHYFDRFLRHHLGHHHDEADALAAHARSAGLAVRIYLPPDADPRIVAAFAGRVLPLPVEGTLGEDAGATAAAWRAAGVDAFTVGDVVYLASLRPGELVGTLRFLAMLPPGRRPVAVLRVYDCDDFVNSRSPLSATAGLWRRAMAEIADLPIRLVVVSETASLARIATGVLARPVHAGPSPVPLGPAATSAAASPWGDRPRPHVLFFWHRRSIAVADLVACLRRVRMRCPDASLTVKLNDYKSILHVREYAHITGTLGVPMILDFLARAELTRLLAESDLVVLPYRLESYRYRASGPFVMAAALGRPVVVPTESWMSAEIEAGRGAGMIYVHDRPEVIAGATVAALGRLERLARRAASAAPAVLRTHGSDRFFAHVMQLTRATAAHAASRDGDSR